MENDGMTRMKYYGMKLTKFINRNKENRKKLDKMI